MEGLREFLKELNGIVEQDRETLEYKGLTKEQIARIKKFGKIIEKAIGLKVSFDVFRVAKDIHVDFKAFIPKTKVPAGTLSMIVGKKPEDDLMYEGTGIFAEINWRIIAKPLAQFTKQPLSLYHYKPTVRHF